MSTRRQFLGVLLSLTGVCALAVSENALARRGRIRFHGHGLSGSSNYSGSVLSRAQLKSCVMQEQSINATIDRLDQQEAYINQQQAYVDNYSQQSVDAFNEAVERFNAAGTQANAQVASFNSSCANQAYYESDMTAVRSEIPAGQ